MRKLPLLLLCACFVAAVSVQGQVPSQAIELTSPAKLDIAVSNDVTKLRVFYKAPPETRIFITDAGPLIAPKHIGFVSQGKTARNYSFDLQVDISKVELKAGESHSGMLVFRVPTATPTGFTDTPIPFTVRRAAPSFTATSTPSDICLTCGEPRLIGVLITNSGQVPLRRITVGTVLMVDSLRGHRWVLPRAEGRRCGQANVRAAEVDGKIVVEPCSSVDVDLRPGDARMVSIAIKPPQYAGDYSTTVEISAEGAAGAQVTLTTRVRGPAGGSWWPGFLFLSTVLVGFGAAQWLEHVFGAGGAAARTRALIRLHRIREELVEIQKWTLDKDLGATRLRIAGNLGEIAALLRDASSKTPEALDTEAVRLESVLGRRRKLQQRVNFALENHMGDALVRKLDDVLDEGTPDQYDAELAKVVRPSDDAKRAKKFDDEQLANSKVKQAARAALEKSASWMSFGRRVLLFAVSFITAYGMFYAKGCNFGSIADYFGVFVWALGLTQAGSALTNEVQARARQQQQQPTEPSTEG